MPVIEIDLDDTKFKAFAAEFAKYQEALKKAGLGARAVAGATAAGAAAGASGGNKAASAWEKFRRVMGDVNKSARDSLPIFGRIASITADIAKSMASAAWSAAKWLTFGALGGGFGLGMLASGASATRRESGQLGLKPGELKAGNLFFDRYLGDTQSVLSNIAAAQADPTKQKVFATLGVNPQGKDPYQLLTELLTKVGPAGKKYGFNPQVLQGLGISDIFSTEQVRGLANLPAGELQRTIGEANKAVPSLALSDKAGQQWQDFISRMGVVGTGVENTFAEALTKITPELEKFAKAMGDTVDAFVKNGGLDGVMTAFSDGLKWLTSYLTGDDFKNDIKSFAQSLRDLSDIIHGIAHPVDAIGNTAPAKAVSHWWDSVGEWGDKGLRTPEINAEMKQGIPTKAHAKLLRDLERTDDVLKDYPGLLESVQRLEHGWGTSPKGAAGPFQFMPDTAARYGLKPDDRFNYEKAAVAAEQLMRDLLKRYGGDVDKALAGYNWGTKGLDADLKENGKDWLKHAPKETQDYIERYHTKVSVQVQNSTGGSAIVSAAAASGPGS